MAYYNIYSEKNTLFIHKIRNIFSLVLFIACYLYVVLNKKIIFCLQKYIFFSDYKTHAQTGCLSIFGRIMAIQAGFCLDALVHRLTGI